MTTTAPIFRRPHPKPPNSPKPPFPRSQPFKAEPAAALRRPTFLSPRSIPESQCPGFRPDQHSPRAICKNPLTAINSVNELSEAMIADVQDDKAGGDHMGVRDCLNQTLIYDFDDIPCSKQKKYKSGELPLMGDLYFGEKIRNHPLAPSDSSNLKATLVTLYNHHMNSDDDDTGRNADERLEKYKTAARLVTIPWISHRKTEYMEVEGTYEGADANNKGTTTAYIAAAEGFYFRKDTMTQVREHEGDLKGQEWRPNNDYPTLYGWSTGGHRHSSISVRILASYMPDFIRDEIIKELRLVQQSLNGQNIPFDIPTVTA